MHSIYFEVLSEHGFLGLFLFLTLLAFTWLSAGWIIRNAKRHADLKWAENLARMLQVSGIAYCASGAFLGMAYFDFIYLLVALTVATRQLVARHIAGLAPAPRRGLVPRAQQNPAGPAASAVSVGARRVRDNRPPVGARPARDVGNQQLATKASRAGRAPTGMG
ncbi:MAG: hypothetical protein IPM40_13525 [Gammaproteobacteria bacterium]|nr:hypothetical protein [Gammaproteobacteria bacterium]